MRIAIDLRSLIEPLPSGVTEYTRQIVGHCSRITTDDHFVLFANAYRGLTSTVRSVWESGAAEWKVSRQPNKIFNTRLLLSGRPQLDRYVGGADVFFMPNLNFASFSNDCKLVVTVHDLSFMNREFTGGKSTVWHALIRPKKLLRRAEAIIAVSRSTAIDLADRFPDIKRNITVIPSGVDEKYFQLPFEHSRASIIKKYRLPDKCILFLATVENRKNVSGLLQAWEILQSRFHTPYTLVVAGRIVHPLSERQDVRVLGYVSENDKPSLYRHAAVFCYPSFFEGFGLPVLEAMASGTPTLASYSTSLPEITELSSVLINPYNAEEMAYALHELLLNETLRKRLSQAGIQQARKFNWRRSAQHTLDLFHSLKTKKNL
ncbi:MAG: glycosyltransferase family 1 protein [Patescibacteria group bacterium]